MLQKISGIEKRQGEERGGHHDFPSKICCLTVPKTSSGKLLFQKVSGIEKCKG